MASKRTLGNPNGDPTGDSNHYQAHETRRNPTIPPAVPPRPLIMSRPRIPATHPEEHGALPDGLRVLLENDALMRQHAIDHPGEDVAEVPTGILPQRRTAQELDNLKHCWLSHPAWDIEFSAGFELHFNELAAWHDEQIALKAKALGCSHLMASVLENLVRCWINNEPPRNGHAQRFLASYR